jgi:outer membrane protein assembly factor BamB
MILPTHSRRALAAVITAALIAMTVAISTWTRVPPVSPALAASLTDPAPKRIPMFGEGPSRNMVNTRDKNLPHDWSVESGREKHVLWSADLGRMAWGVVVGDGKVFVATNNQKPRNPKIQGDRGVLMCFRASDGKFLWQATHDKLPSGRVNDSPQMGIGSMPAVDGKRLYYVSNRCELICADTEGFADGKNDGVQDERDQGPTDADIIWRLDMMKELKVFPHNLACCSPLVVGDHVFVVTGHGVDEGHINVPEPNAPSFLCVNKHTGKVVWSDASPGDGILHGQWSNPAYAVVRGRAQVIFPGGDGWLYAFEPDTGRRIWKFNCNLPGRPRVRGGRGTRNEFVATPVVYEDRLYIGTGQDPEHDEGLADFWCIDLARATRSGPLEAGGDVSPLKDGEANPRSALAWHFGGKAPENSERNYIFGRTLSTVAVHDGLVYLCELAGYFHCLDARTGKKYWEHNLESAVWSSPYWVDSKIYQGNDAGQFFIFSHGKEKKEPAMVELGVKYVRATPVAANGVLYVVTDSPTRLYAIGQK